MPSGTPIQSALDAMREQGYVLAAEAARVVHLTHGRITHYCGIDPPPFRVKRLGRQWFVHLDDVRKWRGLPVAKETKR